MLFRKWSQAVVAWCVREGGAWLVIQHCLWWLCTIYTKVGHSAAFFFECYRDFISKPASCLGNKFKQLMSASHLLVVQETLMRLWFALHAKCIVWMVKISFSLLLNKFIMNVWQICITLEMELAPKWFTVAFDQIGLEGGGWLAALRYHIVSPHPVNHGISKMAVAQQIAWPANNVIPGLLSVHKLAQFQKQPLFTGSLVCWLQVLKVNLLANTPHPGVCSTPYLLHTNLIIEGDYM